MPRHVEDLLVVVNFPISFLGQSSVPCQSSLRFLSTSLFRWILANLGRGESVAIQVHDTQFSSVSSSGPILWRRPMFFRLASIDGELLTTTRDCRHIDPVLSLIYPPGSRHYLLRTIPPSSTYGGDGGRNTTGKRDRNGQARPSIELLVSMLNHISAAEGPLIQNPSPEAKISSPSRAWAAVAGTIRVRHVLLTSNDPIACP